MRTIKFRGWHKTHLELFDIMKIDWNENEEIYLITSSSALAYDHDDGGFWEHDPKDCELMQFTGLLDKNGKEIYEGDIVKINYGGVERTGDVRFILDRFMVCDTIHWPIANDLELLTKEVIGNIYENPELLT